MVRRARGGLSGRRDGGRARRGLRYVNPAIERVLGYAPEELLGMASDLVGLAEAIIHPEDRGYALRELAEAASGGARRPVPVRARHKDGSWRYLEGHINNLSGDQAVGGIVFVSQDVTRRVRAEAEARELNRRLEAVVEERTARLKALVAELEERERVLGESEERFRITFDSAAVGMAHVSPDGGWLRVNAKLSEIVGYEREELLRKTFQDITHPADLDVDLGYVERMLAGEISEYSVEKRYVRKDRSRVWIKLSASLVRDGSGAPCFFVSVIEDVTGRKLRELVPDGLTQREMQVLRHIVAGRTNPEISRSLLYSLGTVKLCVQRIISKLGVQNRRQAASLAVEIGLSPPARP
ncbi:PAS domain S-box protein [Rubrobacter marinus]|uniref:PAS domain S-box protein n=1 Tax=Rubrobacter marinus TaxID=2653852 RepID=A0A6G8Q070_9ACTN|nr:PAS domain S-box protein [Rubrobacter marinus]QIN79884.1 PAS domain S-box protein [Rubrobacter marinus]